MAGNGSNGFDLISAGIGGLSNIASGLLTNWQNRKMQAEQNAFNREEREFAQQFQDEQRTAQNDWSERMYNDYESPQALVNAFSDAGLNPRLAVSNASSPGVSSGSSGSGHMASPTAPPYLDSTAYSFPFGEIAQGLKSLSEAKKNGIDTKYLEDEWKEKIKGMKLANAFTEFRNLSDKKYLNKERQENLNKLMQDIEIGKLTKQEIGKRIDLLGKELGIKQNELENWKTKFQAELNKINSETDLNKASKDNFETETRANRWKAALGDNGGELLEGMFDIAKNLAKRFNISFEEAQKLLGID